MDMRDEEALMRSVALQNAQSILVARQRAEAALLEANQAMETRTRQLAESLAAMRATLDATSDGVLAVDACLRVTAVNRRFIDMMGLQDSDPAALQHMSTLAPLLASRFADAAQFMARLDEINHADSSDSYDELHTLSGHVIERYSAVQTIDGKAVGRVWTLRDISERRRAEQALRDETQVLELLNVTGAMLSSELDTGVLVQAVTDAATKLSGAKFGAFFYNSINELGEAYVLFTLCGAPRASFEHFGEPRPTALFGPTFSGAPPIRVDDILADPRYGSMGPHHGMPPGHLPVRSYLAVPVIARSGDVIGGLFFGHPEPAMFTERAERLVVGIAAQAAIAMDNARLYDVARRTSAEREVILESERAARAQAERMSAMKDEFLATLSHELRTPLSAILGWSQVLRRGHKDGADLDKGLETIERNARVQAQLIEDLLDMSRIAAGKVRLDVQPLQPVAVIEMALETVRPAADSKSIRLDTFLDPAAGPVAGDQGRLQQIIWNLLSNAIKFTPKNGRVQVLLQRVNSHIEISVADNGNGIEPDFLAHVFERFRQADGTTTRAFGGLGLGLSIVKSLTELHGGRVRAESEGKGRGATFTVELPLLAVQVPAPDTSRLHPTAPSISLPPYFAPDLAGLNVLVVDDEPDARELVQRVLADCGATVRTASSASDAIGQIAQDRPDVLVSDIGMPEMDGYELLRRVRALAAPDEKRLPAIALTAFARTEDRTMALRCGYIAHVAKPVEPAELALTVASVAGRTGA